MLVLNLLNAWKQVSHISCKLLQETWREGFVVVYSVVEGAGLHPNAGPDLVRILKEAGFINVNTVTFDMPIKHSGKIGDLFWYVFKMISNTCFYWHME